MGDAQRLEQVMQNLLSNAIKYSPQGRIVEVRLHPTDHKAVLQVRDSGIGIPATNLAQLFDRFYRADNVRSADIPGSGLGLSIVSEIIALHHGRIEVQSEPGQGSTFSVILPQLIDIVFQSQPPSPLSDNHLPEASACH